MTTALSSDAAPPGGSLNGNLHDHTQYQGPPSSNQATTCSINHHQHHRSSNHGNAVPREVRARATSSPSQPDPPEVNSNNTNFHFAASSQRSHQSNSTISAVSHDRTGGPPLRQPSRESDSMHQPYGPPNSSSSPLNLRTNRMQLVDQTHTSNGTRYHHVHRSFPQDDRNVTNRRYHHEA